MARARRNPHTKKSMVTLVEAQLFGVNIDESHLMMSDSDAHAIFFEAMTSSDKNRKFSYKDIIYAREKIVELCNQFTEKNKHAKSLLHILNDKDINIVEEIEPMLAANWFSNYETLQSAKEGDGIYTFIPGCVFVGFAILVVYFVIHALTFDAPLTGPQIYCQRQGITC